MSGGSCVPCTWESAAGHEIEQLTHRDMGPVRHYLGPLVSQETLPWQDPVPAVHHEVVDAGDIAALESRILASGCQSPSSSPLRGRRPRRSAPAVSAAGRTGRASASIPSAAGRSTTRTRGRRVPRTLEGIPEIFNSSQNGGKNVSLADSSCSAGSPRSSRPPRTPASTSRSLRPGTHGRGAGASSCGRPGAGGIFGSGSRWSSCSADLRLVAHCCPPRITVQVRPPGSTDLRTNLPGRGTSATRA
jgi:hypothetical protein